MRDRRDRGVSEVLGYLLTFGIVVTVVSILYVSGMPIVDDMKDRSALESMETSFVTLQSSIMSVASGQSPIRTMRFNLVKGSIGTNDNAGYINVNATGVEHDHKFYFGNIEYRLGPWKVVYELGAVIASTPGGSIIISDPRIFKSNGNIFISVINVSGNFAAAGGMAEMEMRHIDTTVHVPYRKVNNITINVRSNHSDAWTRYLKDEFGTFPLPGNHNLTIVTHNLTIS